MSCVSTFGDPWIKAWLPAPQGLSQVPASFIASQRQDIHRLPLLTWSCRPDPDVLNLPQERASSLIGSLSSHSRRALHAPSNPSLHSSALALACRNGQPLRRSIRSRFSVVTACSPSRKETNGRRADDI